MTAFSAWDAEYDLQLHESIMPMGGTCIPLQKLQESHGGTSAMLYQENAVLPVDVGLVR